MAIELNANQYAAQFSAFVKFAGHNNQGFVARIEKQKPDNKLLDPDNPGKLVGTDGQARNIVAKSWDGSKNVFRTKGSRSVNNEVRELFLKTILGVCGAKKVEDLPQSVQDVLKIEDFDGKGHPLTARRIKAVTKAVQEHLGLSEAAGAFVSGSSPAASKLQHLVMTAPCIPADVTDPIQKAAVFSTKLRENTDKQIAIGVSYLIGKDYVSDGKINFEKVHDQFNKDYHRGMKIYVGDGKGRKELDRGYEEGRDGLVKFITGEKNATFEGASDSVKRQTVVMMSIINQFASSSIMHAFMETVEREDGAFVYGDQATEAGTNMDFTLTRKSNGDIQITMSQDNGCRVLTVNDENGGGVFYMDGATSCCRVGLDIILSPDRLESVADGDWSKFDYGAFYEAGRGKDGNADNQIARVPEGLRLDMEVTSASAHFDLNAGENPLDKAYEDAMKAREQAGGMKD
jgi:hypothetical protein